MLTYRTMTPEDKTLATQLMEEFYTTDAVCTPPPAHIVERNILAAIDPNDASFRGVLVLDGDSPVGYFMLTTFYSGEVAGLCVMIEQVYVLSTCRGQGIGRQMMEWLGGEYPEARRFQLEVNEGNPVAVRLYEGCGYGMNPYKTMYKNI